MKQYLQISDVIDWQHPEILELVRQIALRDQAAVGSAAWTLGTAKACFEWVRDEIYHSVDYQMNPVTCRASDVLQYKTGYCYAKSHLLAALLRANGIPTGFCYQRLSMDEQGAPYCLHGLNSVLLPGIGWYRVDPRGNRAGVNAQFTPPKEQLAYQVSLPGEVDFQAILAEPLPLVCNILRSCNTWEEVLCHPPDVSPEIGKHYGLVSQGTGYSIRALIREDESSLWKMLMYAAHETSLESVQNQSCLARYVKDWGRTGDMGFLAVMKAQAIGAAWLRLWPEGNEGFGYIDRSIPELAIAVLPEYRGQGIGSKLLMQLLRSAQSVVPAVSLNVRENNSAIGLYQRAGFKKVAGSEVVNRTGGISFNMLCRFSGEFASTSQR